MVTFEYDTRSRKANIICDEPILKSIRSHFSVANEGAIHARRMGRPTVDRFYAITPKGTFDFGIYSEIEKFLTTKGIIGVTYSESFQAHLDCGMPWEGVWDSLAFPMRYYQKDTVQECLKRGNGVCVLATGAGKSLAQANLIENFMRSRNDKSSPFKCIMVVPGLSLVSQMQKDFKEYGVSFTYSGWTGKSPLQDTQVVVVNTENLNSQFEDHPWIADVDLVLGDECHKYNSSSKVSKLLQKIRTPHKFGFTGTLSLNKLDQWKTLGIFGPVIYEKNSKELRDEKFLTNILAKIVHLVHPKTKKMDYQTELSHVYSSQLRNNFIKKLSNKLNSNTLILVNHLEHGENLLRILSSLPDKKVYFVRGDTELDDRSDIIQQMETNSNVICIAMNKIFSTGINVKNIHNIILAGLGKSFLEIVQGIGRGLRLHDTKQRLTLIDICDNLKYSMNHVEERKIIYDKEQIKWTETEIAL